MVKTILIMEDDESIVESMRYILADSEYKVLQAENKGAMLKELRDNNIDLLILDYWLPQQNGGEILKVLRSQKRTEKLPVIVISASQNIKDEVLRAGADDFIAKPFDIADFVTTIRKYL